MNSVPNANTEPLSQGGSWYRTYKVVTDGAGNLSTTPTGLHLFAHFIFCATAAIFLIGGVVSFKDEPAYLGILFIIGGAGGLIISGWLLYSIGRARIRFDKGAGVMTGGAGAKSREGVSLLREIKAIQILEKLCRGGGHRTTGRGSFASYELSVVFNDGTRLLVMDHGDKAKIEADAGKISSFLGLPTEYIASPEVQAMKDQIRIRIGGLLENVLGKAKY